MAKTLAPETEPETTQAAVDPEDVKLTAKTERAIETVKQVVLSFSRQYGTLTDLTSTLTMKRKELAPRFMKAFHLWQAETGGDFAQFVRHLDPKMPFEREEYRHYRTYQACQYLRRLESQRERQEVLVAQGLDPAAETEARASQGDAVTRLVASLLQTIPTNEQSKLWQALQHELRWTERQVERLKESAEDAEPLIIVRTPMKGVKIQLVHPVPELALAG